MKKIFIPPVLILFSFIFIISVYYLFPEYNLIVIPYSLFGIIPLFIGISMTGQARETLRKHKTSHDFSKPTALVTDGIFKKTRNPMYVGMVSLLIGIALSWGNIIGLSVPLIFFLIINFYFIPFEEKRLEQEFGEDYLKYKSEVKRWL